MPISGKTVLTTAGTAVVLGTLNINRPQIPYTNMILNIKSN
jgi:hypothetical protein